MSVSVPGLIGAVLAAALVVLTYIPWRDFFRQRLAEFDPAKGEDHRTLLRQGLAQSRRMLLSPWIDLSLRVLFGAGAGYLVGRLFDT